MSAQRYSGERCVVVDGPHKGLSVTLLAFRSLTLKWDCEAADGEIVTVPGRWLRAAPKRAPIQRVIGESRGEVSG